MKADTIHSKIQFNEKDAYDDLTKKLEKIEQLSNYDQSYEITHTIIITPKGEKTPTHCFSAHPVLGIK